MADHPDPAADLAPQARHTRRHILDTALDLFAALGYEATTLREIALAAGCSLELVHHYFASKEELVLALYGHIVAETAEQIAALPQLPIAERFHQIMAQRLKDTASCRDALGALFGAAANPSSGMNVFGAAAEDTRDVGLQSFRQLVRDASDAPRDGKIDSLAMLLYSLHFLLILFWLYDRSPQQRATEDLLDFMRDALAMLRPMLVIPMVSSSLTRLAGIMAQCFSPSFLPSNSDTKHV